MKIKSLAALVVLSFALSDQPLRAAEPSAAATELKELVGKIQTKLREGEKTEENLEPELKEFDALLTKHKGEKTDDVAQILYMKALLYQQVLKDTVKGDALMEQLQRDFPDTQPVKAMKQQAEAKKLRAALVEGARFPDFDVKQRSAKTHDLHQGEEYDLEPVLRWTGLAEQTGCEIRREQHPGHLPHRRAGKHHRQGFARGSIGAGGCQSTSQEVVEKAPVLHRTAALTARHGQFS
ncbi:MAG: hypothetical protein NT154_16215 [Verrucomicrobia bacterium]|nr:hypothetical protein [Verrucomicrobiota bacterium]